MSEDKIRDLGLALAEVIIEADDKDDAMLRFEAVVVSVLLAIHNKPVRGEFFLKNVRAFTENVRLHAESMTDSNALNKIPAFKGLRQ
jgi:hypothetical protein